MYLTDRKTSYIFGCKVKAQVMWKRIDKFPVFLTTWIPERGMLKVHGMWWCWRYRGCGDGEGIRIRGVKELSSKMPWSQHFGKTALGPLNEVFEMKMMHPFCIFCTMEDIFLSANYVCFKLYKKCWERFMFIFCSQRGFNNFTIRTLEPWRI